MGCCIALALVISVVRTGWFRLVRRQPPPRAGFAPPARRPAPMTTAPFGGTSSPLNPTTHTGIGRSGGTTTHTAAGPAQSASATVAARPVDAASRGRPAVGATAAVVALSAVIGAGLYSELLAALAHVDLVTVTGDRPGWRTREFALIGGGVAALLVALATGLHRAAAPQRRLRLATALAGAGGAWSLLSVVDMHLTGLVPESLVDPLTDLLLHGPGFLAATTGVGALLAGDRWMNSLSPSTTRGTS
ncbi:MAG TPA: hypothetical protein VL595_20855 [Pseudonocardia sp.]|nr:hypothetical protein [Pseudonocardia sp.]